MYNNMNQQLKIKDCKGRNTISKIINYLLS